ncbi:MAG: ChbG/HpnK family deacetylase [Elusimicrobia bacterium]|nr:ChbG/HpnK family deacetylase [Elusimicrobiota bacterium]
MNRRLIVNADDFGASVAVNEAVAAAFERGILRFASLMARGPAAEDAAARARAHPGLGVGVHLVFSREAPGIWGLRLLRDRKLRRGLRPLIESQIERCLALGVRPTHLDAHWNAHVHPLVFPEVAAAARRYGIPRVRWPGGEFPASAAYAARDWRAWAAGSPVRGDSPVPLLRQAPLAFVFAALGACLKWRAPAATRGFGLLHSGLMTEDYVIWLLRRLPKGTTEVYFHPSSDPATAVFGRPAEGHRSFTELQSLLSPRVRQVLAEERIELARP